MNDSRQAEENETHDWGALFQTFLQEKLFIKKVTLRTLRSYKDSWRAFEVYGKHEISESGLKLFVMAMAQAGLKPTGVNSYVRSINSFLSWLHDTGHTRKLLKAPLQKEPKRVLKTYKPKDVLKLISYQPQTFGEKRMMTMLLLITDTGLRVSEAKSLTRKDIDLEDKEITLIGKGGKGRIVPMSTDCKKILVTWLKEHKHNLIFCSQQGTELDYNNLRRDFLKLLLKAGVVKTEGCFHTFRRFFAKLYAKAGGSLFHLQLMLGHETLEMTRRYTELDEEDLRLKHRDASPLTYLRKIARKRKTVRDKRKGEAPDSKPLEIPDGGENERRAT